MHGRTPTFGFFYRLNIGTNRVCSFCNLNYETDVHFFWNYVKVQVVQQELAALTGFSLDWLATTTSGDWITIDWNIKMGSKSFKVLNATCARLIWKARCNLVFNSVSPNLHSIAFQT